MNIRKATKADLPIILALQKEAFLSEALFYNDFNIQPLQQTIDEVEQEFREKEILVTINSEGTIIGSVRFCQKDSIGYIGKLIVSPMHQNKGIGRALMSEAEIRLKNVTRIELFTGEKSCKNIHLYQTLGYTIFDIIPETDTVNLVSMIKKMQ